MESMTQLLIPSRIQYLLVLVLHNYYTGIQCEVHDSVINTWYYRGSSSSRKFCLRRRKKLLFFKTRIVSSVIIYIRYILRLIR